MTEKQNTVVVEQPTEPMNIAIKDHQDSVQERLHRCSQENQKGMVGRPRFLNHHRQGLSKYEF